MPTNPPPAHPDARSAAHAGASAAPLPAGWETGRIPSRAARELVGHWVAATVMAGSFGVFAILILLGRVETVAPVWDWILVGVGALSIPLLLRAGLETMRWRRFSGVVLEMDPVPGSLGGELGGSLVVPARWTPDRSSFRVVVSCIRFSPREEGEGESAHSGSVIWTREVEPAVGRAAGGPRLSFAVPLPPDLPPAEPDTTVGVHHRWTVRVLGRVPGADLDLAFRVPVGRPDPPRDSSLATTPALSTERREPPGRDITVSRDAGAVRLHYRARRSFGTGVVLVVFGSVFLASGIFFGRVAGMGDFGDVFSAVFSLFGLLFFSVFVLVGGLLALYGVWLLGNTLTVEVTPRRIRARRRFLLLFSRTREWSTDEVERVEARITGQMGQGARATVTWAIRGVTRDGKTVPLGDGIDGPHRLAYVSDLLERGTGIPVREVARKSPRERMEERRAARSGKDRGTPSGATESPPSRDRPRPGPGGGT